MVTLNGERCDARAGDTVASVLERIGIAPDAPGIAVAMDGEVVPRAQWSSASLPEDARVEVLTAMQGG